MNANFVKTRTGSGVELLDAAWNRHAYVYGNTATTILTILPDTFTGYINGSPAQVADMLPETLVIRLADPDSNYTVPVILYNDTEPLTVDGATVLEGTDPAPACSIGQVLMAGGESRLILTPATVEYVAPARSGAFDFSCFSCFWSDQEFRKTVPWGYGDMVTIAVGTDTLRLSNSSGSVMTARQDSPVTGGVSLVTAHGDGRILLRLSGNDPVAEIALFLPDGRCAALIRPDATARSLLLDAPASAASMRLLRIRFASGRTVARVLPAAR